jgi:hypothetical protein
VPTFSLIRLPKSFVELYGLVNKVKGRDYSSGLDDSDDAGNTETAICLLTGEVMRAGSMRRNRQVRLNVSRSLWFLLLIAVCLLHADSASWSLYFARQEKRFWNWCFLLGPEMHSAIDA